MSRRTLRRDTGPKTRRPNLTENQKSRLIYKFCEHVIQGLIKSGDDCVGPFLELVDRESDDGPEYYSIIKNSISLSTIYRRLKDERYTAVCQLEKDFELMLNNCFKFNESSSDIYKQCKKLQTAFHDIMAAKETWMGWEAARLYPSSIPSKNYVTGSDSEEDESDTPDEYDPGMYPNETSDESNSEASDISEEDESAEHRNDIADEDDFAPHSDTGDTAQPNENIAHPAIDTKSDNNNTHHKRPLETTTQPTTPDTQSTQDSIINDQRPTKQPRLHPSPENDDDDYDDPSTTLKSMLKSLITQQITLLTTRINENANNELDQHLHILNQVCSQDRRVLFQTMWKTKAMEKVENMGFKDIFAGGVGGQVEQAFGETAVEQARMICEEFTKGAAALAGFLGGKA